jgi:hypothetical protein
VLDQEDLDESAALASEFAAGAGRHGTFSE